MNLFHKLQACSFDGHAKKKRARTDPFSTGAAARVTLGSVTFSCRCSLFTWRARCRQVPERNTWIETNEKIRLMFIPLPTAPPSNVLESFGVGQSANSSYLLDGCWGRWGFGSVTCWVESVSGAVRPLLGSPTCLCLWDWTAAWFPWHKSMLFY